MAGFKKEKKAAIWHKRCNDNKYFGYPYLLKGLALKDFECYGCKDFVLIGEECWIEPRGNPKSIRCKNWLSKQIKEME